MATTPRHPSAILQDIINLIRTGLLNQALIDQGFSTGGGGSAVWGGITGELADQSDLETVLTSLAPLVSPDFSGAMSYAGLLSDLSTFESAWNEGGTLDIPDGVSSVLNTSGAQIYAFAIVMPANPVNGQPLTITSLAEVRQPTHSSGNGGSIISPIAGFVAGTSFTYRYRASTKTWVPLVEPIQYESNGSGVRTLTTLTGAGTFQLLNHLGLSWGLSLGGASQPLMVSQATADGQSGRGSFLGYQSQNTLNVNDASSTNGEFSWGGYQAVTYNSSIPYGGGASNDDPLILGLVNTGQMFVGGSGVNWPAWNGAPAGAWNWLSFSSKPLICGAPYGAGEAFRIDHTNCVFAFAKAIAITGEDRDTSSANFTVADFVGNVVLDGSGTVQVTMPPNPINGQRLDLMLGTNYVAVSVAANAGQTIVTGAAIGATAGSFASWRYRLANTTWYRIG